MSSFNSLSKPRVRNIAIAASLHDIRRLSDQDDLDHGKRAGEWFKANLTKVKKRYQVEPSSLDIEAIYFPICFHETPYQQLLEKEEYEKYKKEADILKTADALDRYTQPKRKWWLNEDYLELHPSDRIKAFAYKLVVASEELYLLGDSNSQSVTKALKSIFNHHESQ